MSKYDFGIICCLEVFYNHNANYNIPSALQKNTNLDLNISFSIKSSKESKKSFGDFLTNLTFRMLVHVRSVKLDSKSIKLQ